MTNQAKDQEAKSVKPLVILPFGVCHQCQHKGVPTPSTNNGLTAHYHCINTTCSLYMKDQAVPAEVYDLLTFLSEHQPDL